MSKKTIVVTTRHSNAIVRKGETIEVEWTPRIARLLEAGRLSAVTPPPDPERPPTKDELLAEAEARGVHVAKSWTNAKIAEALENADEEGSE